jgi:hypothetical protein
VRKTHDYIHHYRGYWSDGDKCRIRIYGDDGQAPVVVCSQLPDIDNTSVTNMVEYLVAEVIEEQDLPTPLVWVEHYPEHKGEIGEYSLLPAHEDVSVPSPCLPSRLSLQHRSCFPVLSPSWCQSSGNRRESLVALDAHRLLGYCYVAGEGNAGWGRMSMEVAVRLRRRLIQGEGSI